jgi:hypothetical protein
VSDFTISRSTHIQASPTVVHTFVNDFHEWRKWSPWEGLDPNLQRTYSGADAGVGAEYTWAGNRKAGRGSMKITGSETNRIGVTVAFEKPWKATNDITFDITPAGAGTDVTWRMSGKNAGLARVFAKIVNMDKLVGKDFERGLAQLKAAAETADA